LEFNVPFQHKYGYIRDEKHLILLLTGGRQRDKEINKVHNWKISYEHYIHIISVESIVIWQQK